MTKYLATTDIKVEVERYLVDQSSSTQSHTSKNNTSLSPPHCQQVLQWRDYSHWVTEYSPPQSAKLSSHYFEMMLLLRMVRWWQWTVNMWTC